MPKFDWLRARRCASSGANRSGLKRTKRAGQTRALVFARSPEALFATTSAPSPLKPGGVCTDTARSAWDHERQDTCLRNAVRECSKRAAQRAADVAQLAMPTITKGSGVCDVGPTLVMQVMLQCSAYRAQKDSQLGPAQDAFDKAGRRFALTSEVNGTPAGCSGGQGMEIPQR